PRADSEAVADAWSHAGFASSPVLSSRPAVPPVAAAAQCVRLLIGFVALRDWPWPVVAPSHGRAAAPRTSAAPPFPNHAELPRILRDALTLGAAAAISEAIEAVA